MPGFAKSHRELDVYQKAVEAAMRVYEHTKSFPREEMYSLTDQIRRSSRSVAANFAEAWRRRRYEAAFVAKLTDCEAEAAETQTWIEFAVRCNLREREAGAALYREYEEILRMLVAMILKPESWLLAGTP